MSQVQAMARPTPLAPWLVAKLDNEGVLDATTRLTRKARPRRCPTCGIYVLAALEDCIAGRPLYVDLFATTSAGELFALLVGRRTCWLIGEGLHIRDEGHIRRRPADENRVHAFHECKGPALPVNPKFLPKPKTNSTEPPF